MWQTDIFTFRLGGRYAYIVAFMDDYSRFIVGADLFRSPTAQAVIEVYRVAAGEKIKVEQLTADVGQDITIDRVLAVGSGADLKLGSPWVEGATVQATVVAGIDVQVDKEKEKLPCYNTES